MTLPVQFSPPHAGKGQIPHSPGTDDSQIPVFARQGGIGGDVEVSIWSGHNLEKLVKITLCRHPLYKLLEWKGVTHAKTPSNEEYMN